MQAVSDGASLAVPYSDRGWTGTSVATHRPVLFHDRRRTTTAVSGPTRVVGPIAVHD